MKPLHNLIEELEDYMIQLVDHDRGKSPIRDAVQLRILRARIIALQQILEVKNPIQL